MKSNARVRAQKLCAPTLLFLYSLLVAPAWAEPEVQATEPAPAVESPMVEAVDIPTPDVLDPATYATTFRFYNEGGIMSRLIVGPLKRVNFGISFDAQRVIGSQDPHMVRPGVYFKLRAFDGTDILPALALGYDSQGFLYQESTKEFLHKEKGLYLVGSHEIFLPDFELHAGVNINDFDDAKVFGFFGATWKIVSSFALLAEYDNVRNSPDNRVNLGGRFWVSPYFNVDVAARNVGRGGSRGGERIVRLNYAGHFPF